MQTIIKLIKRPRERNKPRAKLPIYDICVVYKGSHRKRVYEKLGISSIKGQELRVNPFRLAYWISKGTGVTGNVLFVLEDSCVI